MAEYDRQNGSPGSTRFDPRRDALADVGPAVPQLAQPATPSSCRTYREQLNRWATYQNAHRPAGATTLPTSPQQFILQTQCSDETPK